MLYVFIYVYGAFKDVKELSPLIPLIAMTISRSFIVLNPILEMIFNVDVRKNLMLLHKTRLSDPQNRFDIISSVNYNVNTQSLLLKN